MGSFAFSFWRPVQQETLQRAICLSRARTSCDAAALRRHCQSYAAHNAVLGISGLLLRLDDLYLQILEGPAPVLADVRRRISADARHHQCRVLSEQSARLRLFAPWSMGLLDLNAAPLSAADCAGLQDYVERAGRAPDEAPAPAEELLRAVPQLLRRRELLSVR